VRAPIIKGSLFVKELKRQLNDRRKAAKSTSSVAKQCNMLVVNRHSSCMPKTVTTKARVKTWLLKLTSQCPAICQTTATLSAEQLHANISRCSRVTTVATKTIMKLPLLKKLYIGSIEQTFPFTDIFSIVKKSRHLRQLELDGVILDGPEFVQVVFNLL
jgi:hypothetical protein